MVATDRRSVRRRWSIKKFQGGRCSVASNSDQKAKPLEERTTQLKTPRTVYLLFRISTGCRQFDKVRFPSHSEIDVAVVLHSETSHHRWLHLHWINELSIDHFSSTSRCSANIHDTACFVRRTTLVLSSPFVPPFKKKPSIL